jgi:hypothetical protein
LASFKGFVTYWLVVINQRALDTQYLYSLPPFEGCVTGSDKLENTNLRGRAKAQYKLPPSTY